MIILKQSALDDRMTDFITLTKRITTLLGDIDKFKVGLITVINKAS